MTIAKKNNLFLAVISGIFLGIAFPPVPTGITALFGFVPFFLLFGSIENYGTAFRYSYLTFFIFGLITSYWAGGFAYCRDTYQMTAGILLLLVHPLFFYVPIVGWIFIRRHLHYPMAICVFPFLWNAFEYLHSMSELSFPWLTLGNTQTYDLAIVQMASLTGVYGISFWILFLNVFIFYLCVKIALGTWEPISKRSFIFVGIILVLYFLPKIYGNYVINHQEKGSGNKVRVAIIQPNIDPFEKWLDNPEHPLEVIEQQTNELAGKKIDLVIWPETAVPFYILHPTNTYHLARIKNQVDKLNVNLLTGIPDIRYYREGDKIPKTSKVSLDGERYDTFNSSMLLRPHKDEIQKYAKNILVPFAERVPFSEQLSFLNAMQWNFGLGGWASGCDTVVFQFTSSSGRTHIFSNMICYESVFPGFVSAFVRKGAEFLTVITNDSWWGNTSGTYQHKQYAILRAVENRRWVVQGTNGGISCFIDPYGYTVKETGMYEKITLIDTVEARNELTYYTRHGDWFAELCLVITVIFMAASFGRKVYSKIRMRQLDGIY